jgi:hypothetical protein
MYFLAISFCNVNGCPFHFHFLQVKLIPRDVHEQLQAHWHHKVSFWAKDSA